MLQVVRIFWVAFFRAKSGRGHDLRDSGRCERIKMQVDFNGKIWPLFCPCSKKYIVESSWILAEAAVAEEKSHVSQKDGSARMQRKALKAAEKSARNEKFNAVYTHVPQQRFNVHVKILPGFVTSTQKSAWPQIFYEQARQTVDHEGFAKMQSHRIFQAEDFTMNQAKALHGTKHPAVFANETVIARDKERFHMRLEECWRDLSSCFDIRMSRRVDIKDQAGSMTKNVA